MIDEEVARILHEAAERAKSLLETNQHKLDSVANALAEREILDDTEIAALIGPAATRTGTNGKLIPGMAVPSP